MVKILISLFILLPFALHSQEFPSEVWHEGKIVLIEGDTLKGDIRYSQETDIVEYLDKETNTAIALTGKKVLYFEILDEISRQYREFFALPYSFNGNYETPVFFEVIHEGKPITLLSRERLEFRVVNPPFSIGPSYGRLELVYTYYFLNYKRDIKRFNGGKRDLYFYFQDKGSEIKKFIKKNNIRPKERSDLLDVILYYNEFFEPKLSNADE